MIPALIESKLAEHFDTESLIATPLTGGCISSVCQVETSSGQSYLLKYLPDAPAGFFEAEVKGLNLLSQTGKVDVPVVELYFDGFGAGDFSYLVLELIKVDQTRNEVALATSLAALHRQTREHYGLDSNNFIGLSPQLNPTGSDWGEFYYNSRILPQAQRGRDFGWLTNEADRLLRENQQHFQQTLNAGNEPACLIHGDLWSGNVLYSSNRAYLIDPAVYYASREAEIAMTELFGGFSELFYATYNQIYPLKEDYTSRRDLLNLYHLMNHANLFGGSYIERSLQSIKEITGRWA